ncbi:MAG: hypothetical protein JOY90_27035 [Bradyrhizobium sp.]|uniref:hypothetical protein n=1 Tax=Bradyrhizobium sp. TaxID=376 RepID=UPI001DB6029C|nr:hypothetical protein [Bradyrhizobium sp.]MBV9564070.1 hypothetical protein [Bradyrhizobium sp.]
MTLLSESAVARHGFLDERAAARDELPDPFGEAHLDATLPPAEPVLGVAGVAVFVVAAIALLAARSVLG